MLWELKAGEVTEHYTSWVSNMEISNGKLHLAIVMQTIHGLEFMKFNQSKSV